MFILFLRLTFYSKIDFIRTNTLADNYGINKVLESFRPYNRELSQYKIISYECRVSIN